MSEEWTKESWRTWILFTMRMPSSMKKQIEGIAFRQGKSQSEVVRRAVDEYIIIHAETEEEKEAAKIMARKRREQLRLEEPKDEYDAFLFPVRVSQLVRKTKEEWEREGFMTRDKFDELIGFVEKEKIVVIGNPKEELIVGMLDTLIAKLREEKDRYRQKRHARLEPEPSLVLREEQVEYEVD